MGLGNRVRVEFVCDKDPQCRAFPSYCGPQADQHVHRRAGPGRRGHAGRRPLHGGFPLPAMVSRGPRPGPQGQAGAWQDFRP
eukprot:5939310-Lingulodinium_polyedra.AAC.1